MHQKSLARHFGASLLALLAMATCWAQSSGGDAKPPKNATPPSKTSKVTLDTAPFIQMVQDAQCAEGRNRIYVIDDQFVFWERRCPSCPDNSWSLELYGSTVNQLLCRKGDSIAGPRETILDDQHKALFHTIIANLDAPDLGLGSAHKMKRLRTE